MRYEHSNVSNWEIQLENTLRIGKLCAYVLLEHIPDSTEFHYRGRLLCNPELIELEEQECVKAMKVKYRRPLLGRRIEAAIVHVSFGRTVFPQVISQMRQVDSDDGKRIPFSKENAIVTKSLIIYLTTDSPVLRMVRM